tara:strand:- start:81 stop:401 length:321 start_codon:yes stop_codon:yes gene_type:complete
MSFFENDASVPFDPARFYAPPKKSNVVMSNPFKPTVDNRPQYLIDRDNEEKRASANYDKIETQKIIDDAQKETQKEDYDRSPINYEANKLSSGLITSIGKLFHTRI